MSYKIGAACFLAFKSAPLPHQSPYLLTLLEIHNKEILGNVVQPSLADTLQSHPNSQCTSFQFSTHSTPTYKLVFSTITTLKLISVLIFQDLSAAFHMVVDLSN